ncbi:MAG: DUF488 family protein [Phycisphaerales bacterium]|nr:DUF488 family protein [Phycisphaerales bacterium]MCB9857062.1 DUF488 family protein [Phycisphaerales bacterium]MCB9861811.1 DUF488 family protein [Phycisphaerales bacterium]
MKIFTKRVYEQREPTDGLRILVDRLWPRGLSKSAANVDQWIPDIAPSDELRKWFGHDARRWPEFRRRYFAELDERRDTTTLIRQLANRGRATLLFAAKAERMNNAVALREYLLSE